MGNFTSCLPSNPQSAKLIDVHGTLRRIKPPITAAEIMLLEQPGHLISPVVDDLRSNFRLSALRADEELSNGRLYFLIPAGRLNSSVTESELEMLRCCKDVDGGKRRRKSKVSPEEKSGGGGAEESGDGGGGGLGNLEEGFSGQWVCSSPIWRPVLDPIFED